MMRITRISCCVRRRWAPIAVWLVVIAATAQGQDPTSLDKAQTALKQAAAEQATAEQALAQQTAAADAAPKAIAAAEDAARKASEENAAAQLAAQQASEKAEQARKTAAEKKAEAQRAAETGEAEAAKASAEAAAAEKAAQEAAQRAAEAQKASAEKQAAVAKSNEEVAAIRRLGEKARADLAEARKHLNETRAAALRAEETLRAEAAYDAWREVRDVRKKIADAEKSRERKKAAARRAAERCATAAESARRAAQERAAAQKALDQAADADKADLQRSLDEKTAAANIANRKANVTKAGADDAAKEVRELDQAIEQDTVDLRAAQEMAAVAHAEALGGLKPLAASQWDYAKARHLLIRAGFGGGPEEVQRLVELGPYDAVDYLVEIDDRPTAALEFQPRRMERAEPWEVRLSEPNRRDLTEHRQRRERSQQAELRRWWLRRMAESPRPLQEKLTLFWHDHFAVQYRDLNRTSLVYRQNELFRAYGCDSYAALLRGIVHDPAMIRYLNNDRNFKGNGNENLGREILELFSLGEGQGYSENDLREASRALTGYSYDPVTEQFRFLATRHDETPKTIFGRKGAWAGDDLVDLILRQPATARYISSKLFAFFVYQEPDPESIDRLAHVMRSCNYDLRPMLKNLFLSQEFYSERAMGAHIKGPVELVIGAIRDLGLEDVDYAAVDNMVGQMGQTLFEPPNVAGWDEDRAWINAERILIRYNRVAELVERSNVDWAARLKDRGLQTPEDVVNYLAQTCLARDLDEETCQGLLAFLGEMPPQDEWEHNQQFNAKLRALVVLILSTPESQMG